MRSGASVCQLLAESFEPRGARIRRALSRRVGIAASYNTQSRAKARLGSELINFSALTIRSRFVTLKINFRSQGLVKNEFRGRNKFMVGTRKAPRYRAHLVQFSTSSSPTTLRSILLISSVLCTS